MVWGRRVGAHALPLLAPVCKLRSAFAEIVGVAIIIGESKTWRETYREAVFMTKEVRCIVITDTQSKVISELVDNK